MADVFECNKENANGWIQVGQFNFATKDQLYNLEGHKVEICFDDDAQIPQSHATIMPAPGGSFYQSFHKSPYTYLKEKYGIEIASNEPISRRQLEEWQRKIKEKHHLVGGELKEGDVVMTITPPVLGQVLSLPFIDLETYARWMGIDQVFLVDDDYELNQIFADIREQGPLSLLIIGEHNGDTIHHGAIHDGHHVEKPLLQKGARVVWTACNNFLDKAVEVLLPILGPHEEFTLEIGTGGTTPPILPGARILSFGGADEGVFTYRVQNIPRTVPGNPEYREEIIRKHVTQINFFPGTPGGSIGGI